MKFKKYYILTLIIFILLVFSFIFDEFIVLSLDKMRNPVLDTILLWVIGAKLPYVGFGLFVLCLITLILAWKQKRRKLVLPFIISFFVVTAITFLLKAVIGRVRPILSLLAPLKYLGSSFPSAHAAVAFAALPFLDKEYPRFKYIWLVFACLIAFSRIYFGVHYLSDVLGGALIGYLISSIFLKFKLKRLNMGKGIKK